MCNIVSENCIMNANGEDSGKELEIFPGNAYKSTVKRNFQSLSLKNSTQENASYLRHHNGILVLLLPNEHPALKEPILKIDFDVNKKKNRGIDRSQQIVVGKGKKGGLNMQPETRICIIRTKSGQEFPIRSGLKATLLEVNERLISKPNLIHESRENRGYIAIIMPKGDDLKFLRKNISTIK